MPESKSVHTNRINPNSTDLVFWCRSASCMLWLARTGVLLLDSPTHTQTLDEALPAFDDLLLLLRPPLLLCLLIGFPVRLQWKAVIRICTKLIVRGQAYLENSLFIFGGNDNSSDDWECATFLELEPSLRARC